MACLYVHIQSSIRQMQNLSQQMSQIFQPFDPLNEDGGGVVSNFSNFLSPIRRSKHQGRSSSNNGMALASPKGMVQFDSMSLEKVAKMHRNSAGNQISPFFLVKFTLVVKKRVINAHTHTFVVVFTRKSPTGNCNSQSISFLFQSTRPVCREEKQDFPREIVFFLLLLLLKKLRSYFYFWTFLNYCRLSSTTQQSYIFSDRTLQILPSL